VGAVVYVLLTQTSEAAAFSNTRIAPAQEQPLCDSAVIYAAVVAERKSDPVEGE
jgi:hypothetical protein